MRDTNDTISVRVARRFSASAEQVFDAWLDPKRAVEWLFATPAGKRVRCEIDPRVGGRFAIVELRDGVEAYHGGVYLELDRPRLLAFSFALDEALSNASRVQIDIRPLARGCELVLTHELSAVYAEYEARTKQGWVTILEGLARAV